ncbi:unnamed protein product, partial [Ilex paraguariensis]
MYEDPLLRAFIAEIMTNCKSLGECLRLIGVAYDPLEMLAQGLSRPMTIYGRAAGRMKAVDMRNRCSVALDSVNYCKNRYTDVIPFDKNRVVLNPCKDYRSSARGYINASFITTSESVSQFIATQGPLPHTFEDFWEMIIQNRCPVIVMLTRLIDNYKKRPPPTPASIALLTPPLPVASLQCRTTTIGHHPNNGSFNGGVLWRWRWFGTACAVVLSCDGL